MQKENSEVIFFDTETKCKIGNINYVVKSFYDDKKEDLAEKIKRLLKLEINKRS